MNIKVFDLYYLFLFAPLGDVRCSLSNKVFRIIEYASYSVTYEIESGMTLYENSYINSNNNHT